MANKKEKDRAEQIDDLETATERFMARRGRQVTYAVGDKATVQEGRDQAVTFQDLIDLENSDEINFGPVSRSASSSSASRSSSSRSSSASADKTADKSASAGAAAAVVEPTGGKKKSSSRRRR